jgi:hypothetical protein
VTDIVTAQPPVVVTSVDSSPAVSTSDTPAASSPSDATVTSSGGATTIVYVNPPAPVFAGSAAGASGPVDAGLTTRPSRKGASLFTAYALFFFFGWTGMHQVYLGNTLRGVSYIFTFSWFTLALWIDLFTLPSQVRRVNTERMLGLR